MAFEQLMAEAAVKRDKKSSKKTKKDGPHSTDASGIHFDHSKETEGVLKP
jgi:hypothetical protein